MTDWGARAGGFSSGNRRTRKGRSSGRARSEAWSGCRASSIAWFRSEGKESGYSQGIRQPRNAVQQHFLRRVNCRQAQPEPVYSISEGQNMVTLNHVFPGNLCFSVHASMTLCGTGRLLSQCVQQLNAHESNLIQSFGIYLDDASGAKNLRNCNPVVSVDSCQGKSSSGVRPCPIGF
jgi:hypothetical protein